MKPASGYSQLGSASLMLGHLYVFVCSASHAFITTYTEINGHAIEGIPEISSVAALDGRQIDYYDSEIKMLIPRQDWMKEFISGDRFKEYTEIRERVQQTNKINITVLMQQFNQTHGVHTYQRMYGCEWDNETGYSRGFDQHGYDGQDFILLDMNELRYLAQLELLRQYYQHECVNWLQHFLKLRKVDLERGTPEVSLLQKDPSSPVVCHVTSFYPSGVTITWLRNGQEHDEDVDLEELLPNEDGTFQRTSFLNIPPDEWEKNQFVCEVQHRGRTFRKILTADEIKSNNSKLLINKIMPLNKMLNDIDDFAIFKGYMNAAASAANNKMGITFLRIILWQD
uniref:Ig-like domain-containing protein n=1 Tax=Cyprinus carpio carpio TaxID=630221 RepID=A0A8C1B5V3_CYPCA